MFVQMAFVQLFPFGRGGPEKSTGVKFDAAYITSLMNLGRARPFQQSPTFIFYSYSWKMKQKVGTVSWLATRNGSDEVDPTERITVQDCRAFLDNLRDVNLRNRQQAVQRGRAPRQSAAADHLTSLITTTQMHKFVNRLRPFAAEFPATEIYMAAKRKQLLSMISSPATTVYGVWQYFFTECQPDMHLTELFDNAITSANPHITSHTQPWYASETSKQQNSDGLTKPQRARILRDHPYLSARLHAAQQSAFWEFVMNGKHKPLGEILDWWRRVEFQEKGTPHSHNLICIKKGFDSTDITEASLMDLNDDVATAPVLSVVRAVSTARLQPRSALDTCELPDNVGEHEYIRTTVETSFNFKVDRNTYFADSSHPCRVRFTAVNRDFSYDKITGAITDSVVQSLFRRLQLANQLHACRDSCYKYCRWGEKRSCRYGFPKPIIEGNLDSSVVLTGQDMRSRMRVKVDPPRNNAHLNVSCTNPLILLACRGNHDIQYMANSYGGAEYVSKYASKTDTIESKALQNAISRKLATATLMLEAHERLTLRQTLRAVGNAMISSQQIGTVHACYVLTQSHLLVQSSRVNIFVNAFVRKEITLRPVNLDEDVLIELSETDSALKDSPSTTLGKRDAYHAVVKDYMTRHKVNCPFDFYAFLSSYQVRKESTTPRGVNSKVREGILIPMEVDHLTGLIKNAYTFTLNLVSCLFGVLRVYYYIYILQFVLIIENEVFHIHSCCFLSVAYLFIDLFLCYRCCMWPCVTDMQLLPCLLTFRCATAQRRHVMHCYCCMEHGGRGGRRGCWVIMRLLLKDITPSANWTTLPRDPEDFRNMFKIH
jgi:hypothetical protein